MSRGMSSGYGCYHCGEGTLRYFGYDDGILLYQCDHCRHFVEGGAIALLSSLEDDIEETEEGNEDENV